MSIIRSAYIGMIYEIRVHCRICRMLEWQNCLRAGGHPGQREPVGYYEITTIPLLLYGAFLFVYSIGGFLIYMMKRQLPVPYGTIWSERN